jgi:hypothetical protein
VLVVGSFRRSKLFRLLKGKKILVGTGRFELPNCSPFRLAPSQAFSAAPLRSAAGLWGARCRQCLNYQIALRPRDDKTEKMVGTGRFELPTPRTPSECSTRLSHVPTQLETLTPLGSGAG